MLTELQKRFVKNIALGLEPEEALISSGYSCCKSKITDAVKILLGNEEISKAIEEVENKLQNLDDVKKQVILHHQRVLNLDITRLCYPVEYTDRHGVRQTRLKVRPVEEWNVWERKLCTGFDRFGTPKFIDKTDSLHELSRIFGLYKDNQVAVLQDTQGIFDDVWGIEDGITDEDINVVELNVDVPNELKELDDLINGMGASEDVYDEEYEEMSELAELLKF